ncbi:MAG: precorrin-3B C(17)-methyltransferase [Alphaproteobacteria bacterium]|nr:precorrin-3B C(17)-methyltransferase [Alphaproteobacteria bacterium]
MRQRIVLAVLDERGAAQAGRLKALLPESELHGLAKRVAVCDVAFSDAMTHLAQLFQSGAAIVGFCASGILIRAVAPFLSNKRAEPPLIAVSATSVVPLLGGHAGANKLALKIADILELHAAITTSSDTRLAMALDDPPPGWKLANPEAAKAIAAALLAGQAVRLDDPASLADWLDRDLFAPEGDLCVRVTERHVAEPGRDLILHPPILALGVGCERNLAPETLLSHAKQVLADARLSEHAVACVASLDLKADERAVHELARSLNVPARFFSPQELDALTSRLENPSDVVFRETGCHGVAEGAALAAAGTLSELIVPKSKTSQATAAVARSPHPIQPNQVGKAQGHLFVVGIGPGAAEFRTPNACRALALSSDLVGYGLYLDLIQDLIAPHQRRHDGTMGAEEDRVRQAIELAAEGRIVSLVCSGDAGIYALATLAFELLEREGAARKDWQRIGVEVVPGLSALLMAAARAGAPLNHDFCVISLSDLLTPMETIRKRLKAAAEGDFALALYNPVSKKRREQIVEARDILLKERPASTPVMVARNLGRDDERLDIFPLSELGPDKADMLSIVLIGNSETRIVLHGGQRRVYTPRGYAGKHRKDASA